ncbi:DUF802 domain-containing protein [Pollutimonas harenae]|uniref:DUF802 domain-containing protein n=1 Tax=Pollutimonas harenae TaxID=657015 RepID=A0A853H441_9BURK|nr:DUF802 domain-containing protein [Pollutimonas harenae]NYT86790.1 DUF802 domain-containing protein [Pollutimonas harenae]TEA71437.1 DUF802 domain-containing protein [Pollutimonas harenae]
MNRFLQFLIFLAGLVAACWIGSHYIASNRLALAITALIAVVYLVGALELYRYQQATTTLSRALAGLSGSPDSLDEWLRAVHPNLRVQVGQRIQGERAGLPRPVLTPYLVGLLVLLGMLGTFLGMVATLRGTGLALESSTDLAAIRASLAAPVQGLGFAFGTSVAGVATSAMLGLLSALCTRDRILAAQTLDANITSALRVHSPAHQREEGFRLLQQQTLGMTAVADKLQAMMTAMERHNQSLNERLEARQEQFQEKTDAAYQHLAATVGQSLKDSVAEGVRSAGTAIQPLVETTMAGLMRDTTTLHDTLTQAVQRQLDGVAGVFEQRSASMLEGVSARLEGTADSLSAAWSQSLSTQRETSEKLAEDSQLALTAAVSALERHAVSLVNTVGQSHQTLLTDLASQDQKRLSAWSTSLAETAEALRQSWQQAGVQAKEQQLEICAALTQTANEISTQTKVHARETIAEMAKLAQSAGEAPMAAASLVAEVRQAFTDSMARDNTLLDERNRLLETSASLQTAMQHASSEQREAIDALLVKSADVLGRVGTQFTAQARAESEKLSDAAGQITGSAVEIASLGEAFGAAVHLFGESNAALIEHLQRIETVLDKSIARSDEQLAYYVAQAKEVIDLSVMSQKQIIEELQHAVGKRPSSDSVSA